MLKNWEKKFDKEIFPAKKFGDSRDKRFWTRAVVKSFIRILLEEKKGAKYEN